MKYIVAIRQAMEELIVKRQAYIMGEDIMEPYGGAFKVTKGLSEKYRNHIIGTPMCEQGITGLGIGMALMGDYVIGEIMFCDFITLVADQLVNHAAKFYDLYGHQLHLVMRTPSGGYRGYGATHSQSLEKMFLGIPGLQVMAANIFQDPGDLLKKALESGKPTLFIENKSDYPKELLLNDFGIFERIDKDCYVRISLRGEEPDITIVTYGGMGGLALEAVKQLAYEEEIICDIIIISDLGDTVWDDVEVRTNKVLVIEEGVEKFGWSAQVVSILAQHGKRAWQLGALDSVIFSSSMAEAQVLVQISDIVDQIVRRNSL